MALFSVSIQAVGISINATIFFYTFCDKRYAGSLTKPSIFNHRDLKTTQNITHVNSMSLKVFNIKYENIRKVNNPSDKIFIQMFVVQINDFVLIKTDMLSNHSAFF